MEKEFLNKLKIRCASLGIDIDILGNSELEITSVNGTPVDTIVVFKKETK